MTTLTTPVAARPVASGTTGAPLALPTGAPAAEPAPAPAAAAVQVSGAALSAHAADLRGASAHAAQDLIGNVANALFGAHATIEFTSASAETSTRVGAAAVQADGAQAAALSLDESAHFIGKGQIVTEDGSHYDFEIEVRYAAHAEASSATQSSPSAAPPPQDAPAPPDLLQLSGRPLPELHFPGGLDDLFKLLGRDLNASASARNGDSSGQLTMRLLRLVNTAALLAPKAQPAEAPAKAAESYAAPAAPAPQPIAEA
ncbi:MAG: hypothetical protein ACXU8N_07510 [Telluria sp.]